MLSPTVSGPAKRWFGPGRRAASEEDVCQARTDASRKPAACAWRVVLEGEHGRQQHRYRRGLAAQRLSVAAMTVVDPPGGPACASRRGRREPARLRTRCALPGSTLFASNTTLTRCTSPRQGELKHVTYSRGHDTTHLFMVTHGYRPHPRVNGSRKLTP
jgi:hypothetical protein